MQTHRIVLAASLLVLAGRPAAASPFAFSDGNVNGAMAVASRPSTSSQFEIEAGDDFIISSRTQINSASFVGLLPAGASAASIANVRVEIYRVFPLDSNVARTSGSPTFSTPQVPTRVNSPSDVALDERSAGAGTLSFTAATLAGSFTAANSIAPGGIHPIPGQTTGGNGPVSGQEVQFNVNFATPFDLPSDHYFFVPQVTLTNGNFYWLSSVRPIVAPGNPFAPDLQAWTRDNFLDPDWLRIGTDIVGGAPAPTFNLAFSLSGEAIPEPTALALLSAGLLALLTTRTARSIPSRSKPAD